MNILRSFSEQPPVIPDHTLIRCVGSGNYGKVWLAQNVMGTFRAIKVIHRKSFREQRPYDREYTGIMKYEPVSRSHPGFVSVLHIGNNPKDQYFYYIMEVADDAEMGEEINPQRYQPKTLASEKERQLRLDVPECFRIGLQLASALGFLHRQGLVHRDIKPSNIIFVGGNPMFADIGLVTDIGETNTFVGSEGYVPPEGPGKPAADLYGLGKVLFEIVTGQHQLNYPKLPSDFDRLPDATQRRALLSVIAHTCELDQGKRTQNARELVQQLEAAEAALGGATTPSVSSSEPKAGSPQIPKLIVLAGGGQCPRAASLIQEIAARLQAPGITVSIDQSSGITVEWARDVETRISEADCIIPILTPSSASSEVLAYEIRIAQDHAQHASGKPRLLPILCSLPDQLPPEITEMISGAEKVLRHPDGVSVETLVRDLQFAMQSRVILPGTMERPKLEPTGGAVPLDSSFYLSRAEDAIFENAVSSGESIVLVKGARQMGKTSLLARGLQKARKAGHKVLLTDCQKLNATSFESIDKFYFALGTSLADQLDLDVFPEDTWDSRRSPNSNIDRFLKKEVLEGLTSTLVWGMDEIDRLFACPFSGDVFSLFRSWHNARALDPESPWRRLSLVMAYATEVQMFIKDIAQSPFNIGVRLELKDFTEEQVSEMNRRYGLPVQNPDDLASFMSLVGGQPYLVRHALHELASNPQPFEKFRAQADQDQGIFNDHLRRLLVLLARDNDLLVAARDVANGRPCPTANSFHRLRAAGIIVGTTPTDARPRCGLYQSYLAKNL